MKTFPLALPSKLHHILQETARRGGRPQAALMRHALDLHTRLHGRPQLRSLGLGSNAELRGAESDLRLESHWRPM